MDALHSDCAHISTSWETIKTRHMGKLDLISRVTALQGKKEFSCFKFEAAWIIAVVIN